jgi:hypothetical protein
MDVFVNFTRQIKTFSTLWPQLLSRDENGRIAPYKPCELLFTVSSSKALLVFLLTLMYFGPVILVYFEQHSSKVQEFLEQNSSTLIVRAIMVVTLFALLLLRQITSGFSKKGTIFGKSSRYGMCADSPTGPTDAVSRFTGYQSRNRLFTFNAVVLLGGVSSLIAMAAAWTLAHVGVLGSESAQPPLSMYVELLFWLVVAYLTGVVGMCPSFRITF